MFEQVVGIEQVGDKQVNHTKFDPRPVITFVVWLVFTLAALSVAASCDDGGMYQGPNDSSPRYGGPK